MRRAKKIILRILLGIGVFLGLIGILDFSLPYIANTERIKNKAQTLAQELVDGRLDYERIEPRLLPLPHARIIQGRIAIPEQRFEVDASVSIRPKLFPLLFGDFKIDRIVVQSPDVRLALPNSSDSVKPAGLVFAPESFKQQAGVILAAVSEVLAAGSIVVKDGRLVLIRKGIPGLRLDDVDLSLTEHNRRFRLEIDGRSNLANRFNIRSGLRSDSFDGDGRIDITGLHGAGLGALLFPENLGTLPDFQSDLHLTFATQNLTMIQIAMNSVIPALILEQDSRKGEISRISMEATCDISPQRMEATLANLEIEKPRLKLSGALVREAGKGDSHPTIRAIVQGAQADITSIRQTALSLIGRTPIYLNIVRGGNLSEWVLTSEGASLADLMDADHLQVRSRVDGGRIFVPGVELDLTEVSGLVRFANGTLKAEQASATYGATTASNGGFMLGLLKDPMPIALDMELNADLAQVPPILNRVIKASPVLAEIGRIQSLKGRADARFSLAGDLDDMEVKVAAGNVSLSADYDRLPYPVTLTGDGFTYDAGGITFKNIGVRLENSTLERLSGRLALGREPRLQVDRAVARITCRELYPWLRDRIPAEGLTSLDVMNGQVTIEQLKLIGLLSSPREWDFDATGTVRQMAVKIEGMPGPIALSSGRFRVDPKRIDLNGTGFQMLDTALDGKAVMTAYLGGQPVFELTALRGDLGDDTIQWLNRRFRIPEQFYTQGPVTVHSASGRWNRGHGLRVRGDLAWPENLHVSAALNAGATQYDIESLKIADEGSVAVIAAAYNRPAHQWDIHYAGRLNQAGIAALLPNNPLIKGQIQGVFTSTVYLEAPGQSIFHGSLSIDSLTIPLPSTEPLKIHTLSLAGHDDTVAIDTLDLTWLAQRLGITGEVVFKGNRPLIDLKFSSDSIDANVLEAAFTDDNRQASSLPSLPYQSSWFQRPTGRVVFDIGKLTYGNFLISPMAAALSLDEDRTEVDISNAYLCGISVQGRVEKTPQGWRLALRPRAEQQALEAAGGCLSSGQSTERMSGTFDVSGELKARGKDGEELLQQVQGSIQVDIEDGRLFNIGNAGFFTNLLSFLSINNLFSGSVPNFRKHDFPYKSLSAQAELADSVIRLKDAYLYANSLNMVAEGTIDVGSNMLDLTVLVSPLTTVDSIVRHVPILGKILQGTLVAVPVTVRGEIADPTILPLSPKAVGSRVLGILERILKAPFQLVEASVKPRPGAEGDKNKAGEKQNE
jgi:uncharacterized protein involved in outer membrane biogenesis